MLCSGEVSDAAFYHMAERTCLPLPSVRRKFQISFYGRYKDDLFLVCGASRTEFAALMSCLRAQSREFKINVNSISNHSAAMLDVQIFKGASFVDRSKLSFRFYRKPTSIWRPLDIDSYHCPSVHMSWPIAYLSRVRS